MKFDKVVMNPPYKRDLFLKISREVLKHSDNIVSLMPVQWLMDPLGQYKKGYLSRYSDICDRVSDIDILSKDTHKLFNIQYYSYLAVYTFRHGGFDCKNYYKRFLSDSDIELLESVRNMKSIKSVMDTNRRDGIRVPIAGIAGNRGKLPVYKHLPYVIDGYCNNKDWTECKPDGGYVKQKYSPLPLSIKFDTVEQALEFYNFVNSDWYRHLCDLVVLAQSIPLWYLPVNPSPDARGAC